MFLLIYLPALGKYQLCEYSLFNLLIQVIHSLNHKESINELPQSSIVLTDNSIAKRLRDQYKSWQCAIWGFRSQY